jgi:phosphatidylglycerophosphate synthase
MFVEDYLKDVRAAGYSRGAWAQYCSRIGAMVRREVWNNPQATGSVLSIGIALFALHLLSSLGVSLLLGRDSGVAYLWSSGLTTLAATLFCLTHLGLVRSREGVPVNRLSPSDWFTLLRATMAPGAYLFCALGSWRLALAWLLLGGLTDVADGALARRFDMGTTLGVVMDPVVDILFNICMFSGLYVGGLIPGWLLAVVALRYGLLVVGAAFLYITRGPVRIRPTVFGKASGVLIYGLVGGRVAIAAFGSPGLSEAASEVLVLGAGFLTAAAVFQVGVMGWNNMKWLASQVEPPAVVADIEFKAPRRREP